MVTLGITYSSLDLTIADVLPLAQPAVSYAVGANMTDTPGQS